MNIFVLLLLTFFCTVFAIDILPSGKTISKIVVSLLTVCTVLICVIGASMSYAPIFSEEVTKTTPADGIEWEALSYRATSTGYDISYRTRGVVYCVQESSSEDADSRYVKKRICRGSEMLYTAEIGRYLFLSKHDYQAVTDWIKETEQQKAQARSECYFQLNTNNS